MLSSEQVAEIKARAEVAEPVIDNGDGTMTRRCITCGMKSTGPYNANAKGHTGGCVQLDRNALLADRDEFVRRLAALEELLRRYHERVTAADDVLVGFIASRSYLNDAMSKLPHPTIGDEVRAALAPAAPLASAGGA